LGKKIILNGLDGLVAGVCTVMAAESYINYSIQKTAIVQEYLSRAPELTDKVFDAANKAAEGIGRGDLISGVFFGGMAGLFAALVLYESNSTKE